MNSKFDEFPVSRRQILALGALAPIFSACGSRIDTAEWTEEVLLHDGRMIQVQRRARAMHGGFPNSERGRDLDFQLTYAPGNIFWAGSWDQLPLSFEVFDGTPYVVTDIRTAAQCVKKLSSDYAAQFFRWDGKKWLEIEQSQFPLKVALKNLFENFWGRTSDEDPRGLVTWKDKALKGEFSLDAPYTIESYFEEYTNRRCQYHTR